jgi:hypothetical protein
MEIEIGSTPARDGFDVHVDGEDIIITQYNDDDDCDVVILHASDALALIDLLGMALDEVHAQGEGGPAPVKKDCTTDPGPHNPDGTCCETVDRSGEMR